MEQCQSCGVTLGVNARFCSNCGKSVHISKAVDAKAEKPTPVYGGEVSLRSARDPGRGTAPEPRSIVSSERLGAFGVNAIQHTLFVVPQHFSMSMQTILDSLGVRSAGILWDADGSNLVAKSQSTIKSGPIGSIRFVCIVGDWSEVPPIRVPNDLIEDGDTHCLSDAFYGATVEFEPTDPLTAIPDIPVGRIPLADREIVYRVMANEPSATAYKNVFDFGVTAECWKEATAAIVSSFPNLTKARPIEVRPDEVNALPKSAVVCSPPWNEKALRQAVGSGPSDPFSLILFNVHGSADEPHWVGEGGNGYVRIFEPGTVSDFNSALLVSEACYGGAMGYDSPSIVEQFFADRGQSFVGSSTIAYGAPSTPISAADTIAMHYVKGLYAGLSQGEALKLAKLEALTEDPLSVEVGLKTVLSFNLFGAPWQLLIRPLPTSSVSPSQGSAVSRPTDSILNRVRSNLPASSASSGSDTLNKFRDQYRARLPPRNRQFLLESESVLKKLHEFRDFSKINEMVEAWGGSLDDSKMDFVSAGNTEGFRLFCHSKIATKAKKTLIISINKSGHLTKTVVSKGVA